MTPSLIPPRSAMARIVVPFMSPVSLNAARAAARIDRRRASAVRRRRRGAAGASAVAGADASGSTTRLPGVEGGEEQRGVLLEHAHLGDQPVAELEELDDVDGGGA